MKPRISYTKPSITNLEVGYATDAAAHGWGTECYDYIHKFEKLFRDHVGSRFSVATSSCTGALQLGIAALGIGHGDEVIMADTNWIASASPFVHAGAVPVFVDILEDTWCIDPKKAEAAITPRTRAIIATHLYGNLCDMNGSCNPSERNMAYTSSRTRLKPLVRDTSEKWPDRWERSASFHSTAPRPSPQVKEACW